MGLFSRKKNSKTDAYVERAEVQYELALRYGEDGSKTDNHKAEQLLRMSGNAGLTEPQFLSSVIAQSQSSEPLVSMNWYQAAAKKGNAEAMFNIGYNYEHGIGVGIDIEQAISWYTQAANCELGKAAFSLGCIYATDDGVKNLANAYEWLNRAVTNGYPRAGVVLYILYCSGEGLDEPNTFLGAKAIRAAAEEKDPLALYVLADLSLYGSDYVDKNQERAWKMMEESAMSGCLSAMTSLGVMYMFGLGGRSNNVEAARDLLMAASGQCHGCALNALGILDIVEGGTRQTAAEGCDLFRQAVDKGNPAGMNNLACLKHCGLGFDRNTDDARRIFEYASKVGSKMAAKNLKSIESGEPLQLEITCGSINLGIPLDPDALGKLLEGGN